MIYIIINKINLKKITITISSIFAGLITVLYFNEFVKGSAAVLLTGGEVYYLFKGIILTAVIPITKNTGIYTYSFLLLIPLLLSVLFIEISSVILRKNNNMNLRQGLVIFQLINVGYLVVNIFIGIISVIFKGFLKSNWARLLEYAEVDYNKQLILMLLILIFLFTYINYSANRLKKYITIVKEK